MEKFQNNSYTQDDLKELQKTIHDRKLTRDLQWCRFIQMTRTPERDLCLELLYQSIKDTEVNHNHIRNGNESSFSS